MALQSVRRMSTSNRHRYFAVSVIFFGDVGLPYIITCIGLCYTIIQRLLTLQVNRFRSSELSQKYKPPYLYVEEVERERKRRDRERETESETHEDTHTHTESDRQTEKEQKRYR